MFSKIFVLTALVVSTLAIDAATSYTKFNDNHNSVQHIQSAPQQIYYSKPSAPQQAYNSKLAPQPAYYIKSAPEQVYYTKQAPKQAYYPKQGHQQAYYTNSASENHAAPLVAKLAFPVAHHKVPVAHYSYAPSSPFQHQKYEEQYSDTPAKYSFSYGVQDDQSGDFHSQEEQRDGDHVVGQYSLHEADGTVRIVKYSDDGHGFQAVVEKQGEPTPAPAQYKKFVVPVAKAVVAAPDYHHY